VKVKSNMGRAGALEVPSKEAKRHTKHRRPDGKETKGTRERESWTRKNDLGVRKRTRNRDLGCTRVDLGSIGCTRVAAQ